MAQSGYSRRADRCPLSGVKRTSPALLRVLGIEFSEHRVLQSSPFVARASVSVVVCCPYGSRQGGILVHPLEQGLLTTDDQPRATTARLQGNQSPVVITWRNTPVGCPHDQTPAPHRGRIIYGCTNPGLCLTTQEPGAYQIEPVLNRLRAARATGHLFASSTFLSEASAGVVTQTPGRRRHAKECML